MSRGDVTRLGDPDPKDGFGFVDFGRVESRPKVKRRSEQLLPRLDVAAGELDRSLVEPEARIVGAEGAGRGDRLGRGVELPHAVEGPGDGVMAGPVRPLGNRLACTGQKSLVRAAVIELEPQELSVERHGLDITKLPDEPDRFERVRARSQPTKCLSIYN